MASPPATLDPSTRAALEKLADIAVPPPVSFMPQTWGWAVLGAILVLLAGWCLARWQHHRKANRYRAAALAELARIERFLQSGGTPVEVVLAIPPVLKRAALAAWPRGRVASLAQTKWLNFLRETGKDARFPGSFVDLLESIEYRAGQEVTAFSAGDARDCIAVAKAWIETHHVSV
jgi:Domain of unknown function (DUF4381)